MSLGTGTLLERLACLAPSVGACLDPDGCAERILDVAVQLADATGAALLRADADGSTLYPAGARGSLSGLHLPEMSFKDPGGSGPMRSDGPWRLSKDVGPSALRRTAAAARTGVALAVPLATATRLHAVVLLVVGEDGGEAMLDTLRLFGVIASTALDNALVHEAERREARALREQLAQREEVYRSSEALSRALVGIGLTISSTLQAEQILERVLRAAAAALGADSASVLVREGASWSVRHALGHEGVGPGTLLPDGAVPAASLAVSEGQPIAIADARSDERVDREVAAKLGISASYVVPLDLGEDAGVLTLDFRDGPAPADETHLAFLRTLGSALSLALRNAAVLDEQRRAAELDAALNEIDRAIGSTLDADEVLRRVIESAVRVMGSDSAAIALYQDGRWVARRVHGMPEDLVGRELTGVQVAHVEEALRADAPLFVNASEDRGPVGRGIARCGVASMLTLPLVSRDAPLGAMFFNYLGEGVTVAPERQAFAARLASAVSLALDNARLHRLVRNERDVLAQVMENAQAQIAYLDDRFRFLSVNDAYAKGCGFAREELLGRSHFDLFPDDENQRIFEAVRDNSVPVEVRAKPFEFDARPEMGVTYWDWTFAPVRGSGGTASGFVLALTDVTASVREKILAEAMSDISTMLAVTLQPESLLPGALRRAAEALGAPNAALCVPAEEGWRVESVVGLPGDLVGRTLPKERTPLLERLSSSGEPAFVTDTEGEPTLCSEQAGTGEHRSYMSVPIGVKGVITGAVTFYFDHPKDAFSLAETEFGRRLGVTLAFALENARLYSYQHRIADTLQQAMLSVPERIEGIRLGHAYASASDRARVGGDFYDLFELRGDQVALVVGDVSGKGLDAATTTALVKNAVRAYAFENALPSAIVRKLNGVLLHFSPPETFVTVFVAVLDTRSGALTFCCAGHPSPLLVHADGTTAALTGKSPLVGAYADVLFTDQRTILLPGESLAIYTDGLTEARRNGEFFGEERLAGLTGSIAGLSAEEAARRVFDGVREWTGGDLHDDAALVVVRLAAGRGIRGGRERPAQPGLGLDLG